MAVEVAAVVDAATVTTLEGGATVVVVEEGGEAQDVVEGGGETVPVDITIKAGAAASKHYCALVLITPVAVHAKMEPIVHMHT